MSNFIHLHLHSDYSPQDGACTVESIAKKASELGMEAVALTDHGRAGGLLQFKKACDKHGVRPIYGVELYMCAPCASRTLHEKIDDYKTSYHLVVLAKNEEGLKNLFRLTSIGWLDGFYYKPRIDIEALRKFSEGLVVLSGCAGGFIPNMLMEDREQEAIEFGEIMREIFDDDFYIEVQDHGISWQEPLKYKLFDFAAKNGYKIVATQDSHFIEEKDADLHAKICKLAAGDLEFESTETYFKSYDEMCKRFDSSHRYALDTTNEIADKCQVNWNFGETIWPVFELPEGISSDKALQEATKKGFEDKIIGQVQDINGYRERVRYELDIIRKMGFATYFLVVADFIHWATQNDIPVGPGRGSGAGSLICYCIGITDVDPIRYGLYFERFLNPARISLPDIDVDFCPRGRKDVMRYVSERYGADRVAQIGTYAAFKPRGSLRDFARVCGYEPRVGDILANIIPADIAGFSLSFKEVIEARPQLLQTEYSEVVDFAMRAEGLRTKMGVHAAGVVISDRSLMEQLPLFRGKHDEIATQFDMHDVEDLGLVKYDFLGLINLTIIKDTIDLVKELRGIDVKIKEDDEEVFKGIFQTGDLDGVFQFETSSGFRDLCVKVKPTSIEDLSAITALFRPGPLGTGLVDKYVAGRRGGAIEYATKELEPILGETYGVMVYQEQIMRICVDLAGYTASEADDMRKAIGKKDKNRMAKHKDKFINGCVTNGISEEIALELFGKTEVEGIQGFAKYSFNKAHSVAYSIISYRTAWLKHHYPEEFYCALFNNTINEKDQLIKYIHSCRDRGIPIEPPDVNRSAGHFIVDHGTIMFGLAGIKGVGGKACDHLLEIRPQEGFSSLSELIEKKVNAGTLKALAASGSLQGISTMSPFTLTESINSLIDYYKKLERWSLRKEKWEAREEEKKQAVIAGHKPPRSLPKPPAPPVAPILEEENQFLEESSRISKQLRLSMERETLGFYISGHPLDDFPGLYEKSKWNIERIQEDGVPGTTVRIPVVISSLIKKRTRRGHDMGITIVEDRTGRMEATIFPKAWKKLKDIIQVDKVALATCKIDRNMMRDEEVSLVKLVLEDIDILSEEDKDFYGKPIITDIEIITKDGTKLVFQPNSETKLDLWQKAKAIATNLEGTI